MRTGELGGVGGWGGMAMEDRRAERVEGMMDDGRARDRDGTRKNDRE